MYGKYLYGTLAYSGTPLSQDDIQPFIPDLMDYLPPVYHGIKEVEELQSTIAKELGLLIYSYEDTKKQAYVNETTWGLTRWEQDLGITTDISKPTNFRREIIKAKLRGRGTVTKALIKSVAEAFTNAEVEVIEKNEEFYFVIKFVGVKGIPPNMAGLKNEIEIIKPAHLLYSFEYTCTWWDSLGELTWSDTAEMTWDELRIYE